MIEGWRRRACSRATGAARCVLLGMAVIAAGLTVWAAPSAAHAADGLDSIRAGARVEVDGTWRGDVLVATKVVVERADAFLELKGFATRIDTRARTIEIPPFVIEVPEDADIDDAHDDGDSYRLDELRHEWRLKVEGNLIGDRRFRAVEIDVDRKRTRALLELEGPVEAVGSTSSGGWIRVLGIRCEWNRATEFDVQEAAATSGVIRRTVDADDRRPEQQFQLTDWLTLGGEVQLDFQLEDDYDLDKHDNGDIFEMDTSLTLEATASISSSVYAFAKGRTAKGYVIFDENRDKRLQEQTKLEELYVYWGRLLGAPLALQLGRQDFDDPREWVYDDNLDAVRLHWTPGPFHVEYSWAGYVADVPRDRRDTMYQILHAEWEHHEDCSLAAYVVDVLDDSDADDSPFFVGLRALGEPTRSLQYWLDYAYLDGVNDLQSLNAHGGDVGGAYQFRDLPGRPYVFASYAFGSGDGRAGGDTDRNYRQTGLQDNNDRTFGVASYRYYGELLRPELSNLHVTSVGVGLNPAKWWSVDVIYHHYRQDHRSSMLRDTVLRSSPSGNSRDLGDEIDVVIGFSGLMDHLDVEIDFGYFTPGRAFEAENHPALWAAIQFEWNF